MKYQSVFDYLEQTINQMGQPREASQKDKKVPGEAESEDIDNSSQSQEGSSQLSQAQTVTTTDVQPQQVAQSHQMQTQQDNLQAQPQQI